MDEPRPAAEGQLVRLPWATVRHACLAVLVALAACASPTSTSDPPFAGSSAPVSEGASVVCTALRYYFERDATDAAELSNWVYVVEAGAETEPVVGCLGQYPVTAQTPGLDTTSLSNREQASGKRVAFWRAKLLRIDAASALVSVWCHKGAVSGFQADVVLELRGESWVVTEANVGLVS